jgi:hypothetical protein
MPWDLAAPPAAAAREGRDDKILIPSLPGAGTAARHRRLRVVEVEHTLPSIMPTDISNDHISDD